MIVWLASYPRSGNTFFRVVMKSVFNIKTYSIYNDKKDIGADVKTSDVVGHKFLPLDFNLDKARKSDEIFYIKTHELLENITLNKSDKIIYLVRDGRESSLSFSKYLRDYENEGEDALQKVLYGATPYGAWSDHVRQWQGAEKLVVNFEELIDDPARIATAIAEYLNIDPVNNKIPTFDELHALNPKFFRSGKKDSWKNVYSDLDEMIFWGNSYDEMVSLDYVDTLPAELNNESLRDKMLDKYKAVARDSKKKYEKIKALESEINSLNTELNNTRLDRNANDREFTTITKEINELKAQLDGIHRSREWRMAVGLQKTIKRFFPKDGLVRKFFAKFVGAVKKNIRLGKKITVKIYIFAKSNYYRFKPKSRKEINANAKKIVYVGHSYHNKTKSTVFLQKYLATFWDVETLSDNSWNGEDHPDLSFINKEEYVGVVFFQLLPPRDILDSIDNDNIIFCPMYDHSGNLDFNYWDQYRKLKVLNFSKKLHKRLKKWGIESIYMQYFPRVKEFTPGKKDEIFFWQRLEKINIKTVMNILGKKKCKIHIHKAIDPGQKFVSPTAEEKGKYGITYSEWFDTREEMQKVIMSKGVYIAPREYEGIGQSFLEAMAMGKAVIAVDNPTMNEYITHGKTGYLFDLHDPRVIDLSNVLQVQKNTYEYMKEGRKKWEEDRTKIIDFIKKDKW